MLSGDIVAKVYKEVVIGAPPSEATNNPEALAFRQQIEAEVLADMKAGKMQWIPSEMPD